MKKFLVGFLLSAATFLDFGATLISMTKNQVVATFVNKTFASIGTDNLDGRNINVSNIVFLSKNGQAFGKMSLKPKNDPQVDQGVYSIKDDGSLLIKWRRWDGSKQLCFHLFETKNAYISIDCNNVFHSAFMKADVHAGNRLS